MAERGNTTHGPHVDDQMKHETQGLVQGGHPTRAEDWRETETIDDDVDVPTGEPPVYERRTTQGGTTDADEDGALTEPVEDKARIDDEEAQ